MKVASVMRSTRHGYQRRHDEALKQVPPLWTTAKDHLIAIFEKP